MEFYIHSSPKPADTECASKILCKSSSSGNSMSETSLLTLFTYSAKNCGGGRYRHCLCLSWISRNKPLKIPQSPAGRLSPLVACQSSRFALLFGGLWGSSRVKAAVLVWCRFIAFSTLRTAMSRYLIYSMTLPWQSQRNTCKQISRASWKSRLM